jgi:hypothetical protein
VRLRWSNDLTLPGGHVEKGIFDADSHLMETWGWLSEFADEVLRRELELLGLASAGSGERS